MNGYVNADTYFAAAAIHNIESLYIAAKRLTNSFSLKNLIVDAIEAGMIGSDIDITEIDLDEVLDSVIGA